MVAVPIFPEYREVNKMENSSIEEVIAYLKKNRRLFHDKFGITSIGILKIGFWKLYEIRYLTFGI